jgi:DNA excision repair protein ERCC-6
MSELHSLNVGGIIGDDMGLGKTAQVISLLSGLHFTGQLRSCLIVCPATVLSHWVRELNTWCPGVRVLVYHESGEGLINGKSRASLVTLLRRQRHGAQVLVTTYGGVRSYRDVLTNLDWTYVVLDEADRIRNPDAGISLICKSFKTHHRIAITGSPIQNNLKELWSIFDFCSPGLLGNSI